MAVPAQDASRYFLWGIPGQSLVIRMRLDLIDRLEAEIKRGFLAVPRGGAEVGGILIGAFCPGDPAMVNIDDFALVPCAYQSGPSFLLSEEDEAAFEETFKRWQPSASSSSYAVGYFRSHTREGFQLEPEDVELLDRFFPDPSHIALLIRPSAGRASTATFFARQHGVFPVTTASEFPLGRFELSQERAPASPPDTTAVYEDSITEPFPNAVLFENIQPRKRTGWIGRQGTWLPISLAFLLLGGMLGFQAGLTIGSRTTRGSTQEFSLSLSVARSDDTLHVTWNRESPAIRAAQKGVLEIEDGGYSKPVDLDAAQLRNGTLIYRNSSNSVLFRLTVYPYGRVSVSETTQWKQ
jgi:hypothetical protein